MNAIAAVKESNQRGGSDEVSGGGRVVEVAGI